MKIKKRYIVAVESDVRVRVLRSSDIYYIRRVVSKNDRFYDLNGNFLFDSDLCDYDLSREIAAKNREVLAIYNYIKGAK